MKITCIVTVIFCLALNCSFGQMPGGPVETSNSDDVDFSLDQVLGYSCLGLGLTSIGFTAFNVSPSENPFSGHPVAGYIVGGTLVAGGLYFLIFGDKETGKTKYWKGMQGYAPLPPAGFDTLNPMFTAFHSCILKK